MPQWFRLDRHLGVVYLACGLAGCRPSAPALLPAGLKTADSRSVAEWVARTAPTAGALHRFTWLYQDEQSSTGGRGSARIALPDSLRFDIAGSLGIGKGSAMVIGDSAQWVVPEGAVKDLIPDYELLWALFAVARQPSPGADLAGLVEGAKTAWRYAEGPDTIEYLRVSSSPVTLAAEVRHAGKIIGRSLATLHPDGSPAKARLTVPSGPAKLEITFYATVSAPRFPPDTWRPPEP
jgi:hypothetical protein